MSATDVARKWRWIEVGNTIAGVVISAVAVIFLPSVAAALIVGFMVLCVADTWYLGSRLKRTRHLFRVTHRR
jgi:hypothetical protein